MSFGAAMTRAEERVFIRRMIRGGYQRRYEGRAKDVLPGEGFVLPKRTPTIQELTWLEKMAEAIGNLMK